jgi:7,8-dihydropterin-6-yl-methyl-4-(beta-D-ribofuranosyl)aminobenzene 5'-phosphate synthase
MGSTVIEPIIEQVKIREASAVEIISLVDNSVDFLSTVSNKQVKPFGQWTRERYGQEWPNTHTQFPFAEHGFSMLVRIFGEGKSSSILFDTGSSPEAMIENAKRMDINLDEIECIVMSHGHYDHCGGLLSAVKVIGKLDLPIIVHQDMFRSRGTTLPDGKIRKFTEFPTPTQLSPARTISTKQPILIANNMVYVTGEIPRKVSYEKGMLRHRIFMNSIWQSDPLIMDDRAIVINVRGKGLVIISGCAHAGIINTIIYAQQITAVEKVHAVMGGFHLAGKDFEERIEPTIKELLRINPGLIVPSHCTGWRAVYAIAKAFPDAFVWNSVGNLYQLTGLRQ